MEQSRSNNSEKSALFLKWTGGDPKGFVVVEGGSGPAFFQCSASAAAGQLTIPTSVLLNLPPSGSFPGFLQVSAHSEVLLPLAGFDIAFVSYSNSNQYSPSWQ